MPFYYCDGCDLLKHRGVSKSVLKLRCPVCDRQTSWHHAGLLARELRRLKRWVTSL